MFLYLRPRLFLVGLGIWAAATAALRAGGQHVLHPGDPPGTLVLFAVTIVVNALARSLVWLTTGGRRDVAGAT